MGSKEDRTRKAIERTAARVKQGTQLTQEQAKRIVISRLKSLRKE